MAKTRADNYGTLALSRQASDAHALLGKKFAHNFQPKELIEF